MVNLKILIQILRKGRKIVNKLGSCLLVDFSLVLDGNALGCPYSTFDGVMFMV